MGGWDRLSQVAYYVWPDLDEAEEQWALTWLSPTQLGLWATMSEPDRAHAVRVARRLSRLEAPAWVLEAALLHDCGKPSSYGLVARVLGVLLDRWLGAIPPAPPLPGLRRWLQVYRWHDLYGFEAARSAGTSEPALALLALYADGTIPQAPVHPEASSWLEPLMRCDAEG